MYSYKEEMLFSRAIDLAKRNIFEWAVSKDFVELLRLDKELYYRAAPIPVVKYIQTDWGHVYLKERIN